MAESDWETITDSLGTFRQRWECAPPGPLGSGIGYVVTDDEWNAQFTERVIRAWQPQNDLPACPTCGQRGCGGWVPAAAGGVVRCPEYARAGAR